MQNEDASEQAAAARISPLKRISGLWLIPLVSVLVGSFMVYQSWTNQGPLITIEFLSAQGLEAGKTKIKTRDVDVGEVEDITLNEAINGVIVTARIHNEFRNLLVEGSRFWVVQPTISLTGVSGLNTLVSGQYIRFSPGSSKRQLAHFIGLEQPPLTPLGSPGLHITLSGDQDYSFSKGDVIKHLGIAVGKIEEKRFAFEDNKIYYDAFIEAPYHQLISSNTRFWKNSALRAEVTSRGFELEAGSVDAVLTGGISFTTPVGLLDNEAPDENKVFYIYPNRNAINEKQFQYALNYWVMVKDTVSGLDVGAPVMYRGIQVGRVLQTDYIPEGRNLLDPSLEIPVLIEINPGRLGMPDDEASLQRATADINDWIRQGLTATMKSQNILLGQQMVELEYGLAPLVAEPERFQDFVVIPTGIDTIQKFTLGIEELIARLNRLPIESLLGSYEQVAKDVSATLGNLDRLAETGMNLVNQESTGVLLEQLNATLLSVEQLAQGLAADSRTTQEVQLMLKSVTDMVEEFRPLVVELKNNPNSLIFPRSLKAELEPVRKQQ